MRQVFALLARLLPLAGVSFLLLGCSGGVKGVKVGGSILKDGKAASPPTDMKISLSFQGKDEKGGATTPPPP